MIIFLEVGLGEIIKIRVHEGGAPRITLGAL
jgi:hypothetical protein